MLPQSYLPLGTYYGGDLLDLPQGDLRGYLCVPPESVLHYLCCPIETQIGRWKTVISPKLKAHNFENQKTEATIGVQIPNQMTELGRPNFQRTA